ncbi:MAG: hypothetical protein ACRD8A_03075 [Candidatus Acidiferrales bacterium]
MERAYRNLGYVLIVLLPIFIAGFWVPYLSEIPRFDQSISGAVHVHAVLLFSFLGLLIVQPLAIRYKAFSAHRILGKLSNILMPFIVVFSVAVLWKEYHEHLAAGATIGAARNAEFLSAVQLLLFGTLYVVAIAAIRRRDVAMHMRCMICIVLVLLPAGLARMLGYWFDVRQSWSQTVCLIVIDGLLLGLMAFDRNHRSVTRRLTLRPYTLVLSAYIVIEAVWLILGRPI